MSRVPVLVCGNELRGDDAAGFATTASLPEPARSLAAVRVAGQLEADRLLEPGVEPCVVVDTVLGIPPGSVIVLPLTSLPTWRLPGAPTSSHAVDIGQAVALAEAVAGRVLRGLFVGIGGGWLEADAPLSPAVAAAIPAARLAVASAVERMAGLREAVRAPVSARGG